MRKLVALTASAAVLVSSIGLEEPATAGDRGLAVGTCVVTGYGSKAVIIGTTKDGYKVRFDLTGGISEHYHTAVTAAPCPAGAAGSNAQPAPPVLTDRGNTRQAGGQAAPQPNARGGCFVSETGGAGLEGTLRGVIRRAFEKEPAGGLDGRVTVRFQSFRVSPGRKADIIDQVQYKPNLSKPVYSVRAQFETCTDYRTATTTRQMERNFLCFTNSTGGQNCSVTGTTAGMRKDTEQYVPK